MCLLDILLPSHLREANVTETLKKCSFHLQRPGLKRETGDILHFCYCQQLPQKDPQQQYVNPSFIPSDFCGSQLQAH